MLKFKVKTNTHKTISLISKYLCIAAFIGALGFFGHSMYKNHQEASTILNDAVYVDADLLLTDVIVESGRKGRTKSTYEFTYSYEAGGSQYEKSFTTSENNADKYVDLETLPVAYAKSNPALSGKVDQLEKNSSLGSLAWRGLVALFGLMFLAWALHAIITGVTFTPRDEASEQS